MTTVLLASALPESAGRVSLVNPSLLTLPVTGATSSTTDTMVGLTGASVSTVKPNASDATLVLPALSTATTVMLCAPWLSAVAGVKVQSPEALAVTLASSTPLS
ncbi:hypothetical protein D3C86_1569640 [compost metagenome]